jgi:hypothetical protein
MPLTEDAIVQSISAKKPLIYSKDAEREARIAGNYAYIHPNYRLTVWHLAELQADLREVQAKNLQLEERDPDYTDSASDVVEYDPPNLPINRCVALWICGRW